MTDACFDLPGDCDVPTDAGYDCCHRCGGSGIEETSAVTSGPWLVQVEYEERRCYPCGGTGLPERCDDTQGGDYG